MKPNASESISADGLRTIISDASLKDLAISTRETVGGVGRE